IVCSYVRPWKAHVRESFDLLVEAVRGGLEGGDLEFVGPSTLLHRLPMFHPGQPLVAGARRLGQGIAHRNGLRPPVAKIPLPTNRQIALTLMGKSKAPARLAGEDIDAYEALTRLLEAQSANNVCIIHIFRCQLAYLFGDYAEA